MPVPSDLGVVAAFIVAETWTATFLTLAAMPRKRKNLSLVMKRLHTTARTLWGA